MKLIKRRVTKFIQKGRFRSHKDLITRYTRGSVLILLMIYSNLKTYIAPPIFVIAREDSRMMMMITIDEMTIGVTCLQIWTIV